MAEESTPTEGADRRAAASESGPAESVGVTLREDDLEPHAGLRYIAWLFKALSILLVLLLIGEFVVGLTQEGRSAMAYLMVEATRLIVFAGLLWGAGDMALMLIESNHDLRATRVLVARLAHRVETLERKEPPAQ